MTDPEIGQILILAGALGIIAAVGGLIAYLARYKGPR